ncbi:MotA/TolQ/ExbB proton channel family protein [Granulosicoccus antarcticus]|uniref:Biopolymer transport protein ExbB n=1 Tax=Granulosicoccus antarcticus IMCC3135 TaxID=1192854 RepID=A0A2Z2NU23_9GAMM|nr:MotA/TolQ/ExbB proton channel family protein [Granulosicoccus antarcticus]ASJ73238.1 Biopolymer transport protein ExbB [Granulosicoccus antarcticus IMCC3135]
MADTDSTLDFLNLLQQLAQRGGPVVLVLLLMAALATAIFIGKSLQFHRLDTGKSSKLYASLREWRKGHWQQAFDNLKAVPDHPVGRVMNAGMRGLLADKKEATVREEVTRIARNHLERLRSWLRALELIASLSPLLGLLGTVIGMIEAFRRLESAGNQVDPALLSGGIWQALLTTAVGLIVAIPALVAHQWLERRVERCAHTMEDCSTRIFTTFDKSLHEASKANEPAVSALQETDDD